MNIKDLPRPHGNKKFTCFISGQRKTYGSMRKHISETVKRLKKAFADDPRVGDRVQILTKIGSIGKRKNKLTGVVTRIDGGYYYVRPAWCKFETELYENEIKKI